MIPMTTAERLVPKIHPLARAVEPDDPMILHALWRAYGEAGIQARIDRIVYAEEVSRFRTTIQEESEPGEEEPELIELALPPHWRSAPGSARPEGSSNAASL